MKRKKRILLIEDDPLHAKGVKAEIEEGFPDLAFTIHAVTTESEFFNAFEAIAAEHWDLAIIDLMLPWAHPAPDLRPPPEHVRREGYFRAGARCAAKLAQDARTSKIPRIVFTVLDNGTANLPPDTHVINKEEKFTLLVEKLRSILLG
jgi:CheY-like chemotaxis protein